MSRGTVYFDLETYSEAPIAYGSHAYAAHPSAEVLLWGYAIDDEPAQVWDVASGARMPEDLCTALMLVGRGEMRHVWQNGVMFDTVFLHYVMPQWKFPMETIEDTRVMAYQAALPGQLAQLCEIFRLPQDKSKDHDGRRLIQLFCKPLPAHYKLKRATSATHPEDWQRFVNYCRLDVESIREVYKKLPRFNSTKYERKLQILDARINRRGIGMDIELARRAIEVAEENRLDLAEQTKGATRGEVAAATQRDALLDFIFKEYGWKLESMTRGHLEKRLNDDSLPEPVKDLINLRLKSTKNSVSKYQVVVDASTDGRLRGTMQFRGASRTGRWAGRLFQPQNLPRPTMPNWEIECAIEAAKNGTVSALYDDVADVLANCLRGLIVAPEGGKLCVADYSNVEGRVLAWLAGEEWKLQAFRNFDAGHGHDLYKLTYGRTFGIPPEKVTKPQRQMGKVLELAMGYQGGPGAFVTFAQAYGMNLDEQAEVIHAAIAPSYWADSFKKYEWAKEKKLTRGLSQKTWAACDAVKSAWRAANSQIVDYWKRTADAAKGAIAQPGKEFKAGRIVFRKAGGYLLAQLPSGRYLAYPSPRIAEDGSCDFSYMGVNQYTKKWERIKTYGGKVVENITQATACDLLGEAGIRLEEHGFRIVLSIHDEYIAEAAPDAPHEDMERIMAELPPWAEGLPLVAAGFESNRYKKE